MCIQAASSMLEVYAAKLGRVICSRCSKNLFRMYDPSFHCSIFCFSLECFACQEQKFLTSGGKPRASHHVCVLLLGCIENVEKNMQEQDNCVCMNACTHGLRK